MSEWTTIPVTQSIAGAESSPVISTYLNPWNVK